MKWRSMTDHEVHIFNTFINRERVDFLNTQAFKRYARRQGEKDMLVHFEPDLEFQLLKIDRRLLDYQDMATIHESRDFQYGFYLIFYEPQEQLFMKLSDEDFGRLFGPECEEVMDSTALYAIRKHNQSETDDDGNDETFGSF